jgi:hypothetical protein
MATVTASAWAAAAHAGRPPPAPGPGRGRRPRPAGWFPPARRPQLAIGLPQHLGLVPGKPDDGDPWFQPGAVRVAAKGGQQHQPVQPRVSPQGPRRRPVVHLGGGPAAGVVGREHMARGIETMRGGAVGRRSCADRLGDEMPPAVSGVDPGVGAGKALPWALNLGLGASWGQLGHRSEHIQRCQAPPRTSRRSTVGAADADADAVQHWAGVTPSFRGIACLVRGAELGSVSPGGVHKMV